MSGVATQPPFSSTLSPAPPTTARPRQPGDPVIEVRNAVEGTTRIPVSLAPRNPKKQNVLPDGMQIRSSDKASLVSPDKKFRLFVKDDGEITVMGPNGQKMWSSLQHHRRDAMMKGKGPFRLTLQKNGNLTQYNAKNEAVWFTDSHEKGKGPFRMILYEKTGVLRILDANNTVIWSSAFPMTCDEARSIYLHNYKDVAKAGVDPWVHYKTNVIDKPVDKKEKRVWLGPKCLSCQGAKSFYHTIYTDSKNMDAAEHYLKFGKKQKREWRGQIKCLNTLQQNQFLEMGKMLISLNGKYSMWNQSGGNLVVYTTEDKKARWSLRGTYTTNHAGDSATYRLKLLEDGNLVYITAKGDLIWQSDSGGKANAPFELKLMDDGNVSIYGRTKDKKPLAVWSSQWPKQCELARQGYLRLYKEVAQAKLDPWTHYTQHVLSKPIGEKDAFVWPGPKCVTDCDRVRKAYHKLYPEVSVQDAGWHFAERGQKQNRVWQGVGKNPFRCVNSVISPGYIHTMITSENGFYKATFDKNGVLMVSSELGIVWQHTKHTSRKPGKGPYTLQLQNDGNLVALNANGTIYWDTNSANMGYPPYKLVVSNMGDLRIMDQRNVLVWSTGDGWQLTCAGAASQYKKEYGGSWYTWDDYLESLLRKPQEKKVWRGPRCDQCSDAYARYIVEYPEVKNHSMNAAEHYVKIGKFQRRLWTGFDDCWKPPQHMVAQTTKSAQTTAQTTKPPQVKPTTPKPTTSTKPPTPKPTTTVIDGKVYKICMNPANATKPDEWGRKWGSENGDTCLIFTK